MVQENYITYKQAIKFKELGFNWHCHFYYVPQIFDENHPLCNPSYPYIDLDYKDFNADEKFISAPTLALANKWIREKGLYIDIWQSGSGYNYYIEENGNSNYDNLVVERKDDDPEFNTYEEALSDAIDKALEKLKVRKIISPADKDLLTKDLCTRFPYKVMISYNQKITELNDIKKIRRSPNCKGVVINNESDIEYVKPYLFPLSSMTETQKDEIYKVLGFNIDDDEPLEDEQYFPYLDWLNEHHFDYRGLIDKKLALDATDLNIY